MADEPTNGELARRLDDILRTVQGLVGQAQYVADQRRIDDRLDTFRSDLTEVRADCNQAIASIHQRITDEAKRAAEARQGWKQIIYTGLVPAFVVFLSILVQIWMHGGSK